MTQDPQSPVKQALLEIRALRAELAQREAERHAPVAIIGMALRTPGDAVTPDEFWTLLDAGRDAIIETPTDRWDNAQLFDADPDAPGKVATRYGGFLRGVDQFDADFFGISRREAESLDPQQRILLEVTWEALERAGVAPTSLAGSNAGVYLGIANSDYWRALYSDRAAIDVYAGTGGALSVASGRLAYVLGLHGPALSIDTACSSSLVAIHLAVQSLRRGETSLALAGGVNVMLSPEGTINFSKARMLAPEGRCKTFDAAADGYVRGEGCVMLVLKRMLDAERDGDRVLAVVRGSAINQDGRSNGLTAPSGAAQEAVLRAALEDADLAASAVHYVEAHGTGTSLGDPIELRALGAVYGAGRGDDDAVVVGSVKTNMGHLEAAAGVAGVAKVVMALQHERLPAHCHVSTPTPLIDWRALHVRLPAPGGEPWPRADTPRRAAVSSFGFSGTNAHVILEEPPRARERAPLPRRPVAVVPLSARTPTALRALAARYADHLSGDGTLDDLAYTQAIARAPLKWARHAIVATDVASARSALMRVADGAVPVAQPGNEARPRVAMLFTGQGAQYAGMARDLYDTVSVVRETIDACSVVCTRELGMTVPDILWGDRATDLLADTRFGQPAIVAVELAMAALWRSWGVEPVAVAGHSLGEFAAAAHAGAISLADAMRLVIARAALVDGLAPDVGGMSVITASRARVAAVIAECGAASIEFAADNGPDQVVITGPITALVRAESALTTAAIEHRRLMGVRHAFHSAQLDAVLPAFDRFARTIPVQAPTTAWVSGLTGAMVELDGGYWARQTRGTVAFSAVARELLRLGVTAFIEVGPHPVLIAQVAALLEAEPMATPPHLVPTLRRGSAGWPVVSQAVADFFAAGGDIDWAAFTAPYAGARTDVPTYPFERQRYWLRTLDAGLTPPDGTAATRRWRSAVRQAERQSAQAPIGVHINGIDQTWALLSRYSTALIIDVLVRCGLFTRAGESRTLDDAAMVGGIVEGQRQLLERWLQRLVRGNHLRRDEGRYISDEPVPTTDLVALSAAVDAQLAADVPLRDYLRNCARLLHDVMTGRATALETLFPDGDFAMAEALYTRAVSSQYINALAGAAIAPLAEHPPERRPARVLEVGSGTGGTTGALVSQLSGSGVEYWFTDVSDTFLGRAEERFGADVTMRTGVFDADRDGPSQGLADGMFDVVTSANALHAVRNLDAAIGHLRRLLTPGGYLLLVESTVHHDWFDISTGLIEGWQHFADDLRSDIPLLPPAAWRDALLARGFESVVILPGETGDAAALGQHVILARVANGEARADAAGMRFPGATATDAMPVRVASPDGAARGALLDALHDAAPSERVVRLRAIVSDAVSSVLRRDADDPLRVTDRLMEHGVDSLMAVQLRGVLSRGFALEPALPATLIFEHPTVEAIAQHLVVRLYADAPRAHAPPAPAPPTPAAPTPVHDVRAMSDAEIALLLEQRYGGGETP